MFKFSSRFILSIRREAFRRRVWFRVLSSAERAILTLTPRCVDTVRSPVLALIIARILAKIKKALMSPLAAFRSLVARPLAERLSRIAQKWGYVGVHEWIWDEGFINYLAVCKYNDISISI